MVRWAIYLTQTGGNTMMIYLIFSIPAVAMVAAFVVDFVRAEGE